MRIQNVPACFRARIVDRQSLPRTWRMVWSRFCADSDWAMFEGASLYIYQSLLVVIRVLARLVLFATSLTVLDSIG